jgi:hypothetical protein
MTTESTTITTDLTAVPELFAPGEPTLLPGLPTDGLTDPPWSAAQDPNAAAEQLIGVAPPPPPPAPVARVVGEIPSRPPVPVPEMALPELPPAGPLTPDFFTSSRPKKRGLRLR